MTNLERGPSSEQNPSMRVEQSSEPPLPKQEEPVAWQRRVQIGELWSNWHDATPEQVLALQREIEARETGIELRPLYTRPSLDARVGSQMTLPKQEEPFGYVADYCGTMLYFRANENGAADFYGSLCTVTPLYTRPSLDARMREALTAAKQFIQNGIELGYIKMPDPDTPDSAHQTLPKIEKALATLSSPVQSGKMGGEG